MANLGEAFKREPHHRACLGRDPVDRFRHATHAAIVDGYPRDGIAPLIEAEFVFVTWDKRLRQAALQAGMVASPADF